MNKLKVKSLVVALAVLLGFSAQAQNQNFNYGIKAGANFSVQSEIAEYFSNEGIKPGLSVGAFGNINVNNWLGLQAEVNYDQKGSKEDGITKQYDYLTVPVLAKISLGKGDLTDMQFNINVGPYAGYLLNAESESEGVTTDMKDNTNDFEFGTILGFGMKYPIANNNIVFDLRLGLGLTAYDKNNSDPKNKYIGVTLGYEF